ncbi:class III extradiol ring-cleavage dioxygenase [Rhodococcus sp. HNM0569]|uniref:dioxygenase family protein n=1 Tax=Rhodococcus sp. HNM0569 TaxID=2716340 RepID=UPI00146C4A83|nr:class III extradiol ring-cleavage dioxygenase [Rhodococcus sp. HNM0569]NLU82981.1 dioxygenase [Rhodococcus sp. HNM0569]
MTADAPGSALPALYLSHGAPPLVDDARWVAELRAWARALPRPDAILVVSAHWESAPVAIGSTHDATPLVYDFGGFPERFYRARYPSPGAPELARMLAALLPADEPVVQLPERGLDHGAYVPLSVMYPDADIPVLQMSLPTLDPERLLELGRRLRALREHGVLVVGSGFTTHGLPFLTDPSPDAPAPTWSREFDHWTREALDAGDVDALADFRRRAPGMPYAHPTVEHFAPMFVTLGAAADPSAPPEQVIDGFWMGLAKRSFAVA